ncbi:hypothetical protein QYE76_065807 [Lolium multiflorum]|uniref:Uncharacterized protein n=1 Tax=Lolium multiflorum TaxID=4521 RepID=A0AAD8WBI2_LOLMU|nr:hypothetical protein QYE76_065807 [Lolium multiflorum]
MGAPAAHSPFGYITPGPPKNHCGAPARGAPAIAQVPPAHPWAGAGNDSWARPESAEAMPGNSAGASAPLVRRQKERIPGAAGNRLFPSSDKSSLVVSRVLTTQSQAIEDQRCNIFQTRASIGGKSMKVIIDGGSFHNFARTELCEKLNLTLHKHPTPYHVQWLSDKCKVKIQHTVTFNFKIGPYEDTIECDVVPMTVCHMLLGRPWQQDKKATHDGRSNTYTFKVNDKKFELRPITPSQIIGDNVKALARAQQHKQHGELRGEGVIHLKESERHKPNMGEIKSVLIATKSELREEQDIPYTIRHHVLIDVFLNKLPLGLPPLQDIQHHIDLIQGATPHQNADGLCVIRYKSRQGAEEKETPLIKEEEEEEEEERRKKKKKKNEKEKVENGTRIERRRPAVDVETTRAMMVNTVEPGTTRAAAGGPLERRPAKPLVARRCGFAGVPPDLYLVGKVWMMPRLVSCGAHTYTLNTSLDRLSGCL